MNIPLYIDGSDGTLWPARESETQWQMLMDDPVLAAKRFVRVSDVLPFLNLCSHELLTVGADGVATCDRCGVVQVCQHEDHRQLQYERAPGYGVHQCVRCGVKTQVP